MSCQLWTKMTQQNCIELKFQCGFHALYAQILGSSINVAGYNEPLSLPQFCQSKAHLALLLAA